MIDKELENANSILPLCIYKSAIKIITKEIQLFYCLNGDLIIYLLIINVNLKLIYFVLIVNLYF